MKEGIDEETETQHDKRCEKRTPTLGLIALFLPITAEMGPIAEGLIFNLSRKGAGVLSTHRFEVGARVRVSCAAIAGVHREAQVQWCYDISDKLFRFGLSLA